MTARRLRWLITLWRHQMQCHGAKGLWRRRAALLACLAMLPARAATLRVYNELAGPVIHVSDLFEGVAPAQDRALGAAPAPGERIVVEAPQLAAIARDYGVAWRPLSGAEHTELRRAGTPLPMQLISAALRAALAEAGAPADCDIDLPGFEAPVIPAGSAPSQSIGEVNYEPTTGRFTALLSVRAADMPSRHMRLSGHVTAMAQAVLLTHPLHPGAVLQEADLRTARVHASLLHGNSPLALAQLIGQALRHEVTQAQPLTSADVARPRVIARNDVVRMALAASFISVSGQGVALEEGGIGDHIRVQNPSSHAVVIAQITAAGEVRVLPAQAAVVVAEQ